MSLKMAHVVLQTPDLERMRDWYCAVLGAHVVFENGVLCFITFDEEHHRLAFKQLDTHVPRTPDTVGIHHTAFTLSGVRELTDRYAALREREIRPVRPIQHGVTTSLYYEDPDGNAVELQVDNFATPEEATAYMESAEYAADPVGPFYDPEQLLEAARAGTPDALLTTREWALAHPLPTATSGGRR